MGPPYELRRRRVLERLGDDAALIVAAGPELRAGADGEVKYVPDANVYWLTGYAEPEMVLVLCPSNPEGPFVMFVRPRDAELERWTGPRGGVEAARERYGADAAWPIAEIGPRLARQLADVSTLYARLEAGRPTLDALVIGLLRAGRRSRPRRGRGPRALIDQGTLLDGLRRVKDEHEIALMRRAAEVTVETFRDAARRIHPGAGEWEVEAALDGGFRTRGASGPAFPTIVAGGANATTLHYVANAEPLRAGDLVLLDAGARLDMYCADISRTFPVSGRFTPGQRRLYDVVLAAHDRAIDAVAPGRTVGDVHMAALRTLIDGLRDLGCLAGETDALVKEPDAWKDLYPHRTSHWLGLDVHDVGDYVEDGQETVLAPGMVLTIEPGLYLAPDADACPAELRGTGVRIEDDVLVTVDGRDVLTGALPADADGVSGLMS